MQNEGKQQKVKKKSSSASFVLNFIEEYNNVF
jgi:hypothetical protein